MSHNGLTEQDVEIFSPGLKENHTIMGLHMTGNKARTDTLGFVDPDGNPDNACS